MPKYGLLLSTGKGVINAIFLNFWKINQFYKVKMVVNVFQILAISGFSQLILMAKSWSWAQVCRKTIDLNVSFTAIYGWQVCPSVLKIISQTHIKSLVVNIAFFFDKMITIDGHNSCDNCNVPNGCNGHNGCNINVYCFIGYNLFII